MASATVIAVASDPGHNFSKPIQKEIELVAGLGVRNDAHFGKTVQHLYDMRKNPAAPNLRQVHLMHAELFDDLAVKNIKVTPGAMGENITTRGIDLLGLPRNTKLHIGDEVVIDITGLRSPCVKLKKIDDGLLEAVLDRSRKVKNRPYPLTGVMAIITKGGVVKATDVIRIELPNEPYEPLLPV